MQGCLSDSSVTELGQQCATGRGSARAAAQPGCQHLWAATPLPFHGDIPEARSCGHKHANKHAPRFMQHETWSSASRTFPLLQCSRACSIVQARQKPAECLKPAHLAVWRLQTLGGPDCHAGLQPCWYFASSVARACHHSAFPHPGDDSHDRVRLHKLSFPVSQCSALQHRLSRRPTSSFEYDIVARDHVIARTGWCSMSQASLSRCCAPAGEMGCTSCTVRMSRDPRPQSARTGPTLA